MPDPDPSPPSMAAKRTQDYLIGAPPATPSLGSILRDRIERDGPMGFPDFMAAALYEPTLGYYACGSRQVGRKGDFFTSVSVGPLFGDLLARRFLREWRETGNPARWRIIECGAHDGTLAADILATLQTLDPRAFTALEYVIPEPLPALQAAQRQTLQRFHPAVRFLNHPEKLTSEPLPGIAFGNELLDALPFHIVERCGNRWLECRVTLTPDDRFTWTTAEIHHPSLHAALAPLGGDFPHGYRTEVRTGTRSFLDPLARSLHSGLMLWADYGFARPEYYHPLRTTGTLRTFSNHQTGENPLARPGETDITAHVDFTAVAEAAMTLGGHPTLFCNQATWLTETARDWLLEQEGALRPACLRQFQTLTHPAHLGTRFHFLELSWKPTAASQASPSLAHRLARQ